MIRLFLILLSFNAFGQEPLGCTIDGRVLHAETGQPLNKARVLLRRTNYAEPVAVASTDSEGRFFLTDVAPGRYVLDADRSGYLPATGSASGRVELSPGQHLGGVLLRLHPYGVISGRITDEDGDPINSTPVYLVASRYRLGAKIAQTGAGVRTDDLGQFRFSSLPPGRYLVAAGEPAPLSWRSVDSSGRRLDNESRAVTFYPGTIDISAALPIELASGAKAERIDIRLRRTRVNAITGRASLANQQRPNRSIHIRLTSPANPLVLMNTDATGPDGAFELRGVPPGSYILRADYESGASQFLSAAQPLQVADSGLDGIRLLLGPGIELTGRVRWDGDPPADLKRIQAWIEQVDRSSVDPANVDAQGRFSLPAARPDRYAFGMAGLPETTYLKAVSVDGVEVTEPTMDLFQALGPLDVLLGTDAASVEGVAVDRDRQPAAGVTVLLAPDDEKYFRRYATARSDSRGHYSFKRIAPGNYRLFCFPTLENEAYFEPGFLRRLESSSEVLKVTPRARETSQLSCSLP